VLGVEHRPLETHRVDQHPEQADARFGRGQDLEIPEAEDAPEDRLGQDGVIDLLE
jgi:hypothetical protein